MRYAGDAINIGLIKLLETDNDVNYPTSGPLLTKIECFTEVGNNADFPLIIIEPSVSTEDDVSKDNIDQSYLTNIEVISRYKQGSGGWGANNSIINQIMPLLRGIGVTLDLSANDFKVKTQTIQSITPIREAYDDAVYFRNVIVLETDIQDTLQMQ